MRAHPAQLVLGLDPLGDRRHAELAGDLQDLPGDERLAGIQVHAAHEPHVELDQVGAQLVQQVQRRVAGAHVVERDAEAGDINFIIVVLHTYHRSLKGQPG